MDRIFKRGVQREEKKDAQEASKNYLELEGAFAQEKECLLKVINAFGVMLGGDAKLGDQVQEIKNLVNEEGALPIESIEREMGALKDLVLSQENDGEVGTETQTRLESLQDSLLEACGFMRKMMTALLENFYPLNAALEEKADLLHIDCRKDPAVLEFKETTAALLDFTEGLKAKISEDFHYINSTFLLLLEQVKELEESFSKEFGGEDRLKEIEYFEMKINTEVGSIAHSFDIYATINEIKSVVIEKIGKIKRAVSLRKKEEIKKAKDAQKDIKKLLDRISTAEKDAREMAKKAERFQMAAMKDGLTGLHNRKAFDLKVENALSDLKGGKNPFSLILFDVDEFKEINDLFGRVAGDKVLKSVAQCLKESFREDDFGARYGGDEFVVLIEKMTGKTAEEKISTFRRNLKKRRFVSHQRGEIQVTVSAGIAVAKEGDTQESLLERADMATYSAKNMGREGSG